jgi:DNA mismatch repair protein MutL
LEASSSEGAIIRRKEVPPRIQILSPSVVSRIAAGEVVERPVSVVKELVENAIDAGSRRIRVEVTGGGRKLIRVSDDGRGMPPEDARLAVQPHATSKIVSDEDLEAVETLGFRGEALPSIAAVSLLELSTREADSREGVVLKLEGGELTESSPAGRPAGTTVTVTRLFFNTPARRKFLRSDQTEFRRIVDVITHLSLAHREIGFQLIHGQRQTLNLGPAKNLRERLIDLWPLEMVEDAIFFSHQAAPTQIEGCIGTPQTSQGSRHRQIFILNGRPVTDRTLQHGLFQAYQAYFPKDRHPAAVVLITTSPGQVDVNVHPTKREVRFRDSRAMHDLLAFTVGKALSRLSPRAELKEQMAGQQTGDRTGNLAEQAGRYQARGSETPGEPAAPGGGVQASLFAGRPGEQPSGVPAGGQRREDLISLWQLHNLYIFSAIKSGVVIIDQHAAHERVLYEQAKRSFQESSASSQQMLFPQVVELTQAQLQVFDEHQDLLAGLGFVVRPFGGKTVLVEAEPVTLRMGRHSQVLRDILDDLAAQQPVELDREERLARSFACQGAIKAGERLTQEEMNSLVNMLFATSSPYTCPHGRPTIIRISMEELARKFGR